MYTPQEVALLAAFRLDPKANANLTAPTGDITQDRLLYELARRRGLLDAVAGSTGDAIVLWHHSFAPAAGAASALDEAAQPGPALVALTAVCAPDEHVTVRFVSGSDKVQRHWSELADVPSLSSDAVDEKSILASAVALNPTSTWQSKDLAGGDCLLLSIGTWWFAESGPSSRLLRQFYANTGIELNGTPGPDGIPAPGQHTAIELRGHDPRGANRVVLPPQRGPNDRNAIPRTIIEFGKFGPGETILAGRTDVLNDLVITLEATGGAQPPRRLSESLFVALDDTDDGIGEAGAPRRGGALYHPALTAIPPVAHRAGPTSRLRFDWTGAPQGYGEILPACVLSNKDEAGATTYLSRLEVSQTTLRQGERLPAGLRPGDTFVVLLDGEITVAGETAVSPALAILPAGVPIEIANSGDEPASLTLIEMTGQVTTLTHVPGLVGAVHPAKGTGGAVGAADAPVVFFCIPLISKRLAKDWKAVCHHLDATLTSIYAQTDPNWRIVVVGDEAPDLTIRLDHRFEFISATRDPEPSTYAAMNADAGRKRWIAESHVIRGGGGYLMFADADDLLERRLVEFVRRANHPYGYVVGRGLLYDAQRKRLSRLPGQSVMSRSFDEICGTCSVVRIYPEGPVRGKYQAESYMAAGRSGHDRFRESVYLAGCPVMDLPYAAVAYVRFTSQNLSGANELVSQTQRAANDEHLSDAMRRELLPLDDALIGAFSLNALLAPRQSPKTFGPKRLSVVVCTHNRPQGLADLLASLRPQIEGHWDRELVVVNDGTHSPEYEAALEPYRHFVRYEALPASVGIAQARNRSADLAQGEFLVFTDDDCIVPASWLDWLVARLATQPELDAIGGTTRPRDPEAANFIGRLQTHYDLLPRPYLQRTGEQLLVAACLAIRTATFRAIGGFNTGALFAIAGEDTEISMRLQRHLSRTRIDLDWCVFHVLSKSFVAEVRRFRRYGLANGLMARERTAPKDHDLLLHRRRRDLRRIFLHHYRQNRAKSADFSGNPFVRFASLVAQATIRSAYDEGMIAGAAEWVGRQRQEEGEGGVRRRLSGKRPP